MLELLTATGFDECLDEEVGKTRPFYGWGTREDGDDVEVVIKLRSACPLKEKAMVAEAIAALLAADLGLPIPEPFLVDVTAEYVGVIPDAEARALALESLGINFALEKLSVGFSIWTPGRRVPRGLMETAAEILAFDLLIGNDDRRLEKPNCLFDGKNFAIIDHEMAFPQIVTHIFGWQDPWEQGGVREPAPGTDATFISAVPRGTGGRFCKIPRGLGGHRGCPTGRVVSGLAGGVGET